ncbi:MAG TPA: IS200/IS605 family transposase [Phycisphaerae bacterium]|nr:IS200/IS605 family transposase [Phycisphaerae bacterium]HWC00653.1 IS200/IS605 family transposase [Bryobacteraceae bacterium]
MPQSFGALYLHIIFSTKNRLPIITPEIQSRLYGYLGGILSHRKCVQLAAGGIPDHIHLLVSLARDLSISDCIRDIKSLASGWVHETFPRSDNFAWQSGYAAFSVSYSSLDAVRAYIANQAEHHRGKTFQEEYLDFLQRHEMEYDERYMWD